MALLATEITFLDHIAPRYNIPVPRHIIGDTPMRDIKAAMESWGCKALVKPDVLSGKRDKAGAVITVENPKDALKAIKADN